LVIVALGRVGPWLPAVDAEVQRLRGKIIFWMAADHHDDLGDRDR